MINIFSHIVFLVFPIITASMISCTTSAHNHSVSIWNKNRDAVRLYEWGVYYSSRGQHRKAIAAYSKSIAIELSSASLNNRSSEYNLIGKYRLAMDDANRAIALTPEYSKPYFNRGNAYFMSGDIEKARIDYNRALEIDPDQAETYFNLGYLYKVMGEYNKSLEHYRMAILVDEDYSTAYYNMACCYSILNRRDEALSYLEKALARGFRRIDYAMNDSELKNIQGMRRFNELMQKY